MDPVWGVTPTPSGEGGPPTRAPNSTLSSPDPTALGRKRPVLRVFQYNTTQNLPSSKGTLGYPSPPCRHCPPLLPVFGSRPPLLCRPLGSLLRPTLVPSLLHPEVSPPKILTEKTTDTPVPTLFAVSGLQVHRDRPLHPKFSRRKPRYVAPWYHRRYGTDRLEYVPWRKGLDTCPVLFARVEFPEAPQFVSLPTFQVPWGVTGPECGGQRLR